MKDDFDTATQLRYEHRSERIVDFLNAKKKLCNRYLGDNDGTCPQLTCIRCAGHEGLCDNVQGDDITRFFIKELNDWLTEHNNCIGDVNYTLNTRTLRCDYCKAARALGLPT